jgi:hypothetical protein
MQTDTSHRTWTAQGGGYATDDTGATTDFFIIAQHTDKWGLNGTPTFEVLGHFSSEDDWGATDEANWESWLQDHAVALAKKHGLEPQHTVLTIVSNAFYSNTLFGHK